MYLKHDVGILMPAKRNKNKESNEEKESRKDKFSSIPIRGS